MGYGLRQAGGGKGLGNPNGHGEEGKLLYFINQGVVEGEYFVMPTTTKEEAGYEGGVDII